ncbi:septation protein A [Vibrio crassostreae]|uniref:Inner membrane-spanning protein YciB n=1 Tax=Vibrio crassostreae TaxID=246167 RepID=A0A822MXV1_9VIBR|nr:septation protein A [Vibrio crassostreae]MDH5948295.1 septation protein A [Vibrio crassostreae]ROO64468.1 intracellular septation protein A [Vibrio crassostreae]TCN05775.1 intracellular septation protein A [Vibrio crassostreae]TCN89634.1 intracellular septation protein A [Vibrio crassostreae]TCU12013.1 intracellular septation protein A [Vibrio crassostreae]
MKQILDFIPLIIFFALYKMYDIYTATGALIVASAVQIVLTYFIYKKVEKMQIITFLMVAVFGGMTIFLHDDNFIKWKVTIVYALFAIGLTVSHIMGKSAIKGMLGKEISLPESVWAKINWAWTLFFTLCAILNVYVAFNLPLDVWVNFKVFGLLIATLLFTLLTGVYIYKHLPKEQHLPKDQQKELTDKNTDEK